MSLQTEFEVNIPTVVIYSVSFLAANCIFSEQHYHAWHGNMSLD